MFGFGKKKTRSIIVVTAPGLVTHDIRQNIADVLHKELPDHAILVLNEGMSVHCVEVGEP